MKRCSLFFLFSILCLYSKAQSPEIIKIRQVRENSEKNWIQEFTALLLIPNIAADTNGLNFTANHIMNMMRSRNIDHVQLLRANTKNIPPAIYGEVITPGATKTIIFYAHYDGQPVDSTQWAKGFNPFKPTMVNGSLERGAQIVPFTDVVTSYNPDWRIYGRSASDDKAGVMAILAAYEAIVKCNNKLNYNIKFFFEGEEEAGSTHLAEIFQLHSSLLQSDGWIICDGPIHQSGKRAIIFGARGDAHVNVTVYGPIRPLHSGHYGNWAPNAGLMMAKLLASMKDEKGKVIIKNFYTDTKPLTLEEKAALAQIPPMGNKMKAELKFINQEMLGVSLEEAILIPSLNINGMQSGNVGKKASNVIPIAASAVLDLRLVPGNDYKRQQEKVLAHIQLQGYHITPNEPTDAERATYAKIAKVNLTDGYNAQRTSMNNPFAKKIISAVRSTTKDSIVLLPSMGGSLPLYIFEQIFKVPTVTVPIANHDNNQHAENENIRIGNLWDGIETIAAIMMMK